MLRRRLGLVLLVAAIAAGFTSLLLVSWPLTAAGLLVLWRVEGERRAAAAGAIAFALAMLLGILFGGLVLKDVPLGLSKDAALVSFGIALLGYAPAVAFTTYGAFVPNAATRIAGTAATVAVLFANAALAFEDFIGDGRRTSVGYAAGSLGGPLLGVAVACAIMIAVVSWRRRTGPAS